MAWKIATFNVNGVRARLSIIVDWLKENRPGVMCLQETKCRDEDFPAAPFEELGYRAYIHGQKAYNGVAILTSAEPSRVLKGFDDREPEEDARLISVEMDGLWVVNTYVPQGRHPEDPAFEYKLGFFERLKRFFEARFDPSGPLIWTGDINVAPGELDVYDPELLEGHVGFHPLERHALKEAAAFGFTDLFRALNPDTRAFTFWDYRVPNGFKRDLGWRLDHIMVTRPLLDVSLACRVDPGPRGLPKPSDHAPLWAEFDLERLAESPVRNRA